MTKDGKKTMEDLFIDDLPVRRKTIAEFCNKSPMFNMVSKSIKDREIVDTNNHLLYDFATQDYLGLGFEESQLTAAIDATKKYGTVVYRCRLIATVDLFIEAEQKIADLVGSEACSIFASTTLLNHGVIPALMGGEGVIFLDKQGHATMYEGCKIARDSGSKLVSFPENDFAVLEAKLKEYENEKKKLILVDGVYSMTGNYADLRELDKLAKKYNALVYVDDAHGFGVVGENPDSNFPYGHKGNGLVKYFGLNYENILYIGCFSKAYGTFGSFIACSRKMKEFLISQATPHDLGGMGPASAMSALMAGLKINEKRGDEKRKLMYYLTQRLIMGIRELGFEVTNTTGFPIVYVRIPNSDDMLQVSQILFENNILATPSPYPMMPRGEEGIRLTITSLHTEAQVDKLIHAFKVLLEYNL